MKLASDSRTYLSRPFLSAKSYTNAPLYHQAETALNSNLAKKNLKEQTSKIKWPAAHT